MLKKRDGVEIRDKEEEKSKQFVLTTSFKE